MDWVFNETICMLQLKERIRKGEATYAFSLNLFLLYVILKFFVQASAFLFMFHNCL